MKKEIAVALAFRSREEEKNGKKDGKKNGKNGLAFAHLALLAGAVAIVLGAANFESLATKIGVALVLFYVFAGGIFDARN